MRFVRVAVALIAVAVTALAFSAPVSAATVQVAANDHYAIQVGEFGFPGLVVQGSELSFDWSSNLPLTLVISGPLGVVRSYSSSTHGSGAVDLDSTGSYFMTWTNSGASIVTLEYDYDIDLFAPVHDTIDAILLAVIIGGIVVAVIIVLVIVFVLRGGADKKRPQSQPYSPPVVPLAPTATACPNCGATVDAMTIWCSRCGTKLR